MHALDGGQVADVRASVAKAAHILKVDENRLLQVVVDTTNSILHLGTRMFFESHIATRRIVGFRYHAEKRPQST